MVPAANNPLLGFAQRELDSLRRLARQSSQLPRSAADLLEIRSRLAGLHFRHRASPSGHCRFLETRDGCIVLNLARDDDWTLLPAWLERDGGALDSWESLEKACIFRSCKALLQQGIDLGLAVGLPDEHAHLGDGPADAASPAAVSFSRTGRAPRVLDLSALWAGPLCAQLLRASGCDVIKLESMTRPDGARTGNAAFFEHLNQGKTCARFDPRTPTGIESLRAAIRAADIVIESSRPRALQQFGIHAETMIAEQPHLTWVSITAHGRSRFNGMRIGFGDDAGVVAGLSTALHRVTGTYDIVGDAIADPLAGIRAARLALTAWQSGGGALLDVSLVDSAQLALREAEEELGETGLGDALARWRGSATC